MTDLDSVIQAAVDLLAPFAIETHRPVARRIDIRIQPENLLPAVKTLQDAGWGYLIAITGIDRPASLDADGNLERENSIEVLYTFGYGAACLFLRLSVPYHTARVASICGLIPSATLYERELMELFGVEVMDTPDPRRLIVAEDWPEGVYPMRKSFKGRTTAQIDKEEETV